MEPDGPLEQRLRHLERLVTALLIVSLFQAALLSVIAIGDILPSLFKTIVFVVLLTGLLVLFRKQIPRWLGSLSRFVFAQLEEAKKK